MTEPLTVSQAAKLTGYSERHIRRLCKDEKIKSRQAGGWLYLIDADSLQAYVDEMKRLGSEKHSPSG